MHKISKLQQDDLLASMFLASLAFFVLLTVYAIMVTNFRLTVLESFGPIGMLACLLGIDVTDLVKLIKAHL